MRLDTLRAAVDTVVPSDEWPGGWDGGVAELLERDGDAVLGWARPLLERATAWLDAAGFDGADREAVLARLGREDAEALAAVIRVAHEGYYGGSRGFEPPAWDMVGFRPLGSARLGWSPCPCPSSTSARCATSTTS